MNLSFCEDNQMSFVGPMSMNKEDKQNDSFLHQMSNLSFLFYQMIGKQRINPELVNVLGLKFDFSGLEVDGNFEGPRTRAEKEKQIRAVEFP